MEKRFCFAKSRYSNFTITQFLNSAIPIIPPSILILIYTAIAGLLTIIYTAIILRYLEGWIALPIFKPKEKKPTTPLSILIPARNEADNILHCLNAILAQGYPSDLLEIIVIDDHSTDNTADLVKQLAQPRACWGFAFEPNAAKFCSERGATIEHSRSYVNEAQRSAGQNLASAGQKVNSQQAPNIHLIHLADFVEKNSTQSFKKKAIEIAVGQATGTLIVTTDADCTMGKNWLKLLVAYYEEHGSAFIAAPVIFYDEKNVFQRFQALDFVSMMGVTGAGIHRKFQHLCNGANLAYERAAFYEVNGFEGIDQLASGDDLMLIQKMAKRFPDRIGFIKNPDAATFTTPKRTLQSFMSQRIRWATKTIAYPDFKVTMTWALVWLFCVSIPISLLLAFFLGIKMLWFGLAQLLVKIIIDYIFLRKVAIDLCRKDLVSLPVYLPSIFMELTYIIVIGALGNIIKNYEWKGRRVK